MLRNGLDWILIPNYPIALWLRNKPLKQPSIIFHCWINAFELPYSFKLVIALQPHTVNLKLFTGTNQHTGFRALRYHVQWSCCPLCKQSLAGLGGLLIIKKLLIAGHDIIALLLDGYDQNVGVLSLLVNRTVMPVCNLNSWTGFRIRIDLMRIRIQHFFWLRIRIPDPDPGSGYRVWWPKI